LSTAIQPFSEALPARRARRLPAPARLRAGVGLQTAAGSVSAFFSLESFDRRRGVATYSLRVINRTKSALICRTWVLSASGEPVLAYPELFEIEPFSTSATNVPVWPRDFSSFDRAIAEIVGNGVHCIVEAAAPPQRKPGRTQALVAAGSIVAGILFFAAALGLRGAVPRIAALSVAPSALAGTTVEAQYSASGAGRLSYLITAPDGHRVAGGRLQERSGSIFVPIPASTQAGAYALRVAMEGPLGGTTETRIINAVLSGAAGAQIDDISVHPMVAKPGQSINVAYSAAADGGYVRLVGTDGTIWAQEPFSKGGQTSLVVPPVAGGRELHVLLHVTKGSSAAQSMAGILVASAPAPAPAAQAPAQNAGDPNLPAAVDADANGTFEVPIRTVRSGDAIQVRILSPRNGMRISLNDTQSHEITGTDVGVEADVVTLRAPSVSVATRYTVVANFTDGFGEESIVQPVTILP
jgi:hypothetical protein